MGLLDGFEVIDTITGSPTMSITKNGISFNKTTLEKLACPEYVRALIDKTNKKIAIVPCGKTDRGSRSFYKVGKDTSNGARWNNYDLKQTIETLMKWNLEEESWKITGLYSEEDNALIFDLSNAVDNSRT
jgi:hypothetical protein